MVKASIKFTLTQIESALHYKYKKLQYKWKIKNANVNLYNMKKWKYKRI